jgi:hypothetical protein
MYVIIYHKTQIRTTKIVEEKKYNKPDTALLHFYIASLIFTILPTRKWVRQHINHRARNPVLLERTERELGR